MSAKAVIARQAQSTLTQRSIELIIVVAAAAAAAGFVVVVVVSIIIMGYDNYSRSVMSTIPYFSYTYMCYHYKY